MKKKWADLPDKTKDKIVVAIGIVVAVGSILLLLPTVQTLGIKIGELLAGRTLRDYDKWHRVMGNISLYAMLIYIVGAFIYFAPNKFFTENLPKHSEQILTVACVLATVLFIWFAMISSDIWSDEAYSLAAARHSFFDLLKMGEKADIGHPPAYHAALSIWNSIFGDNIRNARIFSVLPVVLMIWIGTYFFKKEFSTKSAAIFVLPILSSWEIFYYSFEIRMYSWALFWIFLASVCSWYVMKTKKLITLVLFVIVAVCGAYTHYYAAFCLMIYFVFLGAWFIFSENDVVVRKKYFLYVCAAAVIGVLLYSPWIACVLRQMAVLKNGSHSFIREYFAESSLLKIVYDCIFGALFSTYEITKYVIFFFFLTLVVFVVFKQTGKKRTWSLFNCYIPFVLIAFGFLVSVILNPVLTAKYIFPSAALIVLFMSVAIDVICSTKKTIFIMSILCLFAYLNIEKTFNYITQREKQTEEFKNVFAQTIRPETAIVSPSGITGYLYPENIAYTEFGNGNRVYPHGQIHRNILDLPEVGDFCVIVNAIDEEKDDAAYARLYLGGRGDCSDVYLCTTKIDVLDLLVKDEAYVNSQKNK